MIEITDKLWVGDSSDERTAKVDAVLNVARDMRPTRGWPSVEYVHAGLEDGPGNPPSTYCAAVLSLATLVGAGKHVLVACHSGRSRSLAVAMMYEGMMSGRNWWSVLDQLRERFDDLPEPHEAHKEAWKRINWEALRLMVD
jgi:protein-tyrosine phosphatase